MNNKIVDIYLPLDSRDEPNAEVWPIAQKQLVELVQIIKDLGWEPHVLNPEKQVTSVTEGMQVIQKSKGERWYYRF